MNRIYATLAQISIGIALSPGCIAANAETYTVANLADSGAGSLRQAIVNANGHAAGDTIVFAKAVNGTIELETSLPTLTGALSIVGPGANLVAVSRSSASGTPAFRIFTTSGTGVYLAGMTISNGVTPSWDDIGGGIYNSGTLTMNSCEVINNSAPGYWEYGLWSRVGYAKGQGGGIFNAGKAIVENCIVSNNGCAGDANKSEPHYPSGGGIHNAGSVMISNTIISNNTADCGGGVYNSGSATILNTQMLNNTAVLWGGGIENIGSATINLSLVSNNTGFGGGIYNMGSLSLSASSVIKNTGIISAWYETAGGILNSGGGAILKLHNPNISDNDLSNETSSNLVNSGGKVTYD